MLASLVVLSSACASAPPDTTWGTLLGAPGSEAAGYVLGPVRRGHEGDVVTEARDAAGHVVEVHVLDAGSWPEATPAGRYEVDWEGPRSTAPDDDARAVVTAVAGRLQAAAGTLPAVAEVPLQPEPDTLRRRVLGVLAALGTRAVLPVFAPLALLLSLPALRRARAITVDAAAVAALALALRLALGAFGPLHTNGQGALWIAGALEPAELVRYGPGYAELYGALARLGPADSAIFVTNAVVSSLVPALALALAHRLGLGRVRAFVVGVLLAVDPVSIRIAATEAYFVPAAVLAAWAGLAATSSARTAPLVVALLAAAAARLHPTAWAAVAVAPLLAVGQGTRAVAKAGVAAALGATLASGCVIADVLRAVDQGGLSRPALDGGGTALLGAFAGGALFAVPWARTAAPAAGAALVADLLLRGSYGQGELWQQAFDRLFAVPIALGLVASLPNVALRARSVAAGGALVTALTLVLGAPIVRSRTIDDAEHAWARSWLATVPAGCRVLYVSQPDPLVTVRLPPGPAGVALVPIDARGEVALGALLPSGCAYYVRTSACGTTTGAEACTRVEAGLALDEVARSTLPAVPNHRDVHYPGPTVEVAAFRATAR